MTNLITTTDRWLGKEVKGWWIVFLCLLAIIVIILSTISALLALVYVDHPLSPNPGIQTFVSPHNKTTPSTLNNTTKTNTTPIQSDDTNVNTIDMLSIQFAGLLVYYAFREEIVFRLIPLTLMVAIAQGIAGNDNIPFRLILLLGMSLVFGYAHGGVDHLLVQGISGLVFGVVYMKCGGVNYKNNVHLFRGLFCSTFVHYSANYIFSMMTVFLYGMRYFGLPS